MDKQLIFIDDSGDPGFQSNSSSHFVMACALFMDERTAERTATEIKHFRAEKGLNEKYEFKFHRTKKSFIKELLAIILKYDFRVSAVYIDKADLRSISPIVDQSKLYNWTIKELLERLPLDKAKVRIDGRGDKQYMLKASTYLRKELNKQSHKILNIRFLDSTKDDLIQLADIIAGSINRSLQKGKIDSSDYLGIIAPKVDSITKIVIK